MSNDVRTFMMTVPGEDLLRIVFEGMRAAFLTQLATTRRTVELEHAKMTPDQQREFATRMLVVFLARLPESNPYRDVLERYVREVLVPSIMEAKEPELPKLRLVTDDAKPSRRPE